MPGIVGIISRKPAAECRVLVEEMVSSMRYERHYMWGICEAPEMGIFTAWVAHEEAAAAKQVIWNERQDVALLLSGECFPDSGTRTDLAVKGHRFEGQGIDWLVHAYEEEGEGFVEKLNGLFSGFLIDKRQKKALLFNERYGIERIYWHEDNDTFYFASEAKALLRVCPELRAFDDEGVAQYLAFGCTFDSRTLFRNVHILPAASLWSFKGGRCERRRYFSPEVWESQPALSPEAFESVFQETFKRILPRYFQSERRIGISLTAGLDSRMIMACRPETAASPTCYTFSGDRPDTLDARLSARVADACGLEHQILRIGADFFSDFATYADRTIYATDGYLGILGAHEIYLNRQARRLAPVRLTGVFGGEIFRGVSMFKPLLLNRALFNPDFSASLSSSLEEQARNDGHPVTFAAFREIPTKRFGTPAAGRSQLCFRTPYLDNEIVALAYRAPQNYRTSTLPAILLIENSGRPKLAEIPTDMGEMGRNARWTTAVRRIVCKGTFKLDCYHNAGLPRWMSRVDPLFLHLSSSFPFLGLHKFLHYRRWFQRELASYLNNVLKDAETRRSPLWNTKFLDKMVREHSGGRKNCIAEIDAVLTLEAVDRLLLRGGGTKLRS